MKLLLTTLIGLTIYSSAYGQKNYLDEGNSYLNRGDLEKAEQTFKEGIEAEPENLSYQCQLGLTLINKKEFDTAAIIFENVLKLDSNHVAAIWYSGIGNFKEDQYRSAIKRFEKVLTLYHLDEGFQQRTAISKLDKDLASLNVSSGHYYFAMRSIGYSYASLLRTEGLTYRESNRMFQCLEEYVRLQPEAHDTEFVRSFMEFYKKRRTFNDDKLWIEPLGQ